MRMCLYPRLYGNTTCMQIYSKFLIICQDLNYAIVTFFAYSGEVLLLGMLGDYSKYALHLSIDVYTSGLENRIIHSFHLLVSVLTLFWGGGSGASDTYPKPFQHWSYSSTSSHQFKNIALHSYISFHSKRLFYIMPVRCYQPTCMRPRYALAKQI